MKVLYFHQHFTIPTQAGGTRSYELAKHLIARGHSVCVVCGETVKLDLPNTTMKNVHRGMVDGIDVIQIALPYSNKDGIAKSFWRYHPYLSKVKLSESHLYHRPFLYEHFSSLCSANLA